MPTDPSDELSRPHPSHLRRDTTSRRDDVKGADTQLELGVSGLDESGLREVDEPAFSRLSERHRRELPAIEADYAAALTAVPDGDAKDRGVAVGNAAAQAIVALRTGDGSDTLFFDTAYPQGDQPGEYRFTSADFPFAFAPGWGDVTPFALTSAAQFAATSPTRSPPVPTPATSTR